MTTWRPMLATAATVLPTGAEWTYEVKWDGYRVIAVKDGARVHLLSRNAKDLTRDYPTVVAAIARLKPAHVVLDGELWLHGGKSTGPKTAAGLQRSRRARWKHGGYSAAAVAERARTRALFRQLRALLDSLNTK